MNLREGAILQGGKYRIERELGHGGFGVTYLATQVGLNRKVAIKEFFMSEYCERDADTSQVSLGTSGSRDTVERFKNKFIKEAQTIAEMDNHHIIRIHDVFEDNGTAYYVMEYLPGGDLRSRIPSGGMPEAEAVGYIREVADALRYIHSKNILHLDIKPTNILFRGSGEAVLIDFGISKHYDDEGGSQTSSTPVGISEGYAPTEQYEREGVSSFAASTDIYSLGATLYCLLSGSRPPKASIVLNEGLPELPSRVSAATRTAVEHAMQPRRKDRPQSVEEFMALLEAEVKVEEECTVLDEDLRASLVTPSASQRSARPSINRGTVGSASSHPEGKHQQAPPLFIEGVSVGRGSSKRSAEPTPIWKKLLLPAVACIAVVLAVVLWPKGGDTPVKTEVVTQQTEILPPAGRQNDTEQQQSQPTKPQPTPVKEEPVAPTTTPLYVTTTPSGAEVYIDGKKVGTTPIKDKEISRGSHKVKLSKDGYEDKTLTRTFGDKPVVINETLAEKPKPQPQQSSASSVTTSGNKKTYTVNGVSFTMVRVTGGTFTMGASSSDSEANSYEKPAHQVTLSSYSIGETEVTQALWQAVMGSNPSRFTGNLQRPVEAVSWNDCQAFIRKLNSLTGATFRLPTEAEWEYAARGGSQSRGYKYSGSDNLGTVAWYDGNSSRTTHPVKGKQANELGIYDMSGNVYEWCADWFDDSYYANSPSSNPKGPSAGSNRVYRGGSWSFNARGCRVSIRNFYTPSFTYFNLGLRLVSQ